MPSAIEALSGEVKAFESLFAAAICRKSANEKSLAEVTSVCSPAVSWRGRLSSGLAWLPVPGSVEDEQAARNARVPAAMLLWNLYGMVRQGLGVLAFD